MCYTATVLLLVKATWVSRRDKLSSSLRTEDGFDAATIQCVDHCQRTPNKVGWKRN